MNWKSKYGRVTFGVDSTLLGVRDTKPIESRFNNIISLTDKKTQSQNPSPDAHTASSFTQSSVQFDESPSLYEPDSKQPSQPRGLERSNRRPPLKNLIPIMLQIDPHSNFASFGPSLVEGDQGELFGSA